MSPSGGLRGRRGSILGTAVQLGRRGYDSVHFFLALTTFSWSWTLIFGHKAGDAIPERTVEGFFVSRSLSTQRPVEATTSEDVGMQPSVTDREPHAYQPPRRLRSRRHTVITHRVTNAKRLPRRDPKGAPDATDQYRNPRT
mgnify:CR=1 FL=1